MSERDTRQVHKGGAAAVLGYIALFLVAGFVVLMLVVPKKKTGADRIAEIEEGCAREFHTEQERVECKLAIMITEIEASERRKLEDKADRIERAGR